MKINFTLWSTGLAGGVRAIFEIANRLAERGHFVTITALGGDHSWFPLKVEVNYVEPSKVFKVLFKVLNPIVRLRYKRYLKYLDIGALLKKLKVGFQPDFIKVLSEAIPDCDINVATWFPTSFAVYRSGKGIPFYFLQDYEEQLGGNRYLINMFKESLYLPMNIITGSQWLKDWVKQNYGKDAIVSGYGIDHDVFYPRPKILDNIGGVKVMGIFRGLKYKGDEDLINALSIASEKIPNITLVMIGNKNTLLKIVREKNIRFNYVFFENPTDDKMAQLYSSVDLFVFASHVEGFGLPPLEAMACGTPVVTTDCLGVRDFVIDSENAILVPPKNPKALADGIIKILTDEKLREKLREKGLETAKNFSWDKVVDKFEKAFLNSMGRY
ncbi:glycosyltransferase family 4 protein [Caldisericum sp.]|jgi:glycosyltransferase involved in cell wall biosynthesis|uniref:glycosyltransferase family 4 protein n=1 Tax=Caldisericum sp. TaxID=2499687 RepID=UPI003D0D51BD